jgi:hypothetical protein
MTNPILDLIREDDIRHDPFGTALGWHFAICDAMVEWAPPYPPPSWGFRQAMGGPDTEDPNYVVLNEMLDAGTITGDDLLRTGNILARYVNVCRLAGKGY